MTDEDIEAKLLLFGFMLRTGDYFGSSSPAVKKLIYISGVGDVDAMRNAYTYCSTYPYTSGFGSRQEAYDAIMEALRTGKPKAGVSPEE